MLAAHLAATVPPGAPDRVMYQVQRRARRRTFGRTATTAVALAAIIAFVVLLMPGTRNTPTLQIAPITAPPATQHTADACRRPVSTVHVIAEPTLRFDKTVYRAAAGCVQIVYSGAAGHTLAFDPPGPASPHLGSAWGEKGPRGSVGTCGPAATRSIAPSPAIARRGCRPRSSSADDPRLALGAIGRRYDAPVHRERNGG